MIAFATFDSETLDLLQAAIDGVWQNLPPDRRTSQIKERMAGAAMRLANKGVRDPARLAATTLAAAFSRPSDACRPETSYFCRVSERTFINNLLSKQGPALQGCCNDPVRDIRF
jgi:hypothetical protein